MFLCAACGAENRYTQEKEVDTTMVADMLRLAAVGAFDVLVLVSGDSDHAPAVEGVRMLGRQAYVSTWGRAGLSSRLRKAAFDHIDLLEGLSSFEDEQGSSPPAPPEPRYASEDMPPASPPQSQVSGASQTTNGAPGEEGEAEGGEAPAPAPAVEGGPTYEPTTEEAIFIEELRGAERRLRNGYVGANYFVTRWQSSRLDPSPEARRRMLEHLVTTGLIEVYHAPDGNAALRAR